MPLQFTSIYTVGLKETTTTLPLLLGPLRCTTPYRFPNHRQLHQSRLVIAVRLFLIPILSCALVRVCACASARA